VQLNIIHVLFLADYSQGTIDRERFITTVCKVYLMVEELIVYA
jgi:hypothetical protein